MVNVGAKIGTYLTAVRAGAMPLSIKIQFSTLYCRLFELWVNLSFGDSAGTENLRIFLRDDF